MVRITLDARVYSVIAVPRDADAKSELLQQLARIGILTWDSASAQLANPFIVFHMAGPSRANVYDYCVDAFGDLTIGIQPEPTERTQLVSYEVESYNT